MTTALMDVVAPVEQEGTKAAVKTWLKQVGDRVEAGEPLLEIETDKVAMEVAAPGDGVLAEILIHDGQDADTGAVLGRLRVGPDGDDAPPGQDESGTSGPTSAVAAAVGAVAVEPRSIASFDPSLKLSPSVRRLLVETGLDPAEVRPSGRNHRLTAADVLREAERRKTQPAPPTATRPAVKPPPAPATTTTLTGRRVPLDSMRRRIAEHMIKSVATAPHVTALFEADLGGILAHRDANKVAFERQGVHLTLTAYVVMAAVEAMKAVPVVNSRFHDDAIEIFDEVNIGVGTALGDRGLVVPVIHRAQTLSLMGVATRLQEMTTRARAGTLVPADVHGGTFTISNHGVSGSLTASPIVINQPQSAILGIGKLEKRVVVREVHGADAMLIRPMCYVTLTIDHRVIDGAQTNAWLTRFVQALEAWPGSGAAAGARR